MILLTTLKMIARSWWRNKVFFLVSVVSLALGLACTNLLATYFVHEQGVEAGNIAREDIYFLRQDDPMNEGRRVAYAGASIPLRLKADYAEVEDCLRMSRLSVSACKVGGQEVPGEVLLLAVDSSFTRFFDYRVAEGNLKQALHEPDKVALSAACARRLFGGQEALGQRIEVQAEGNKTKSYEVVAVLRERAQSLLRFDMLTAVGNDFYGGVTLLKLAPGTDTDRLERKIRADKVPAMLESSMYYLDPIEDVCFTTPADDAQQPLAFISQTPVQTLYISLLAAVLILVIACCNYTNMSLSRLLQQLRMIHVEKLMGNTLRGIRLQLFGDAFLTVLIAFLLSLLMINDVLSVFNGLLDAQLTFGFFFSGRMLPWLMVFVLLMSVVPAWYISYRLSRMSVSQYRVRYGGRGKRRFVAVLVTVQFAISIGLLFATLAAMGQLRLTEAEAGRYADCIETGDMFSPPAAPLKAALEQRVQGIESVTLTMGSVMHSWIRELTVRTPDGSERRTYLLQFAGDTTFIHTLGVGQVSGEGPARLVDTYAHPVLVNESFVHALVPVGTDPIGLPLRQFDGLADDSLAVIGGVVKDFPVNSLEESVAPATIVVAPYSHLERARSLLIRFRPDMKAEALRQVEAVWKELNPGQPFTYIDMHRVFMERNTKVLSLSRLLTFYALIGLLLTAFGLFGITWYAVRQRLREISIRKVHGATSRQILWLLAKPFCLYALVAYILAMPVTWWLMQNWLQQFAYRATLTSGLFVWPFVIVTGIALLTVCLQAALLGRVNPAECMKTE